jgi:hypothetical protein
MDIHRRLPDQLAPCRAHILSFGTNSLFYPRPNGAESTDLKIRHIMDVVNQATLMQVRSKNITYIATLAKYVAKVLTARRNDMQEF